MSNNSDFVAEPRTFILAKAILVPGGLAAGEGYFTLADNNATSCLLRASTSAGDLRGFYVKPLPNANNAFALPVTSDYMFTDLLNGCQFLAYGLDRFNVTVEHNNFIDAPANYPARYDAVHGANHPYFFSFRPGIDYDIKQGACIIGTFDPGSGWHFWVRQRVDLDRGTLFGPG